MIKTGFIAVFYRNEALENAKSSLETSKKELGAKLGAKLGANEIIIIEAIAYNPDITLIELSKKLKISDIAVYKNIKKLKEKGILIRVGPDKTGQWEVKA